ncbi:peptidase S8/S53 domain-containing protein [Mycena capillaripes]|nr:peptidase S8/S53 domain-containing protein [Mycena capillaripes]
MFFTEAPVAIKKLVAAAKVVKAKAVVNKKPVSVRPVVIVNFIHVPRLTFDWKVVKAPTKTPTTVKKPVAIKSVSKVNGQVPCQAHRESSRESSRGSFRESRMFTSYLVSGIVMSRRPRPRRPVAQSSVSSRNDEQRSEQWSAAKCLISTSSTSNQVSIALSIWPRSKISSLRVPSVIVPPPRSRCGAFPEELSLYRVPSIIAALKKSPDVKSVVGNTLFQVDSPISITPQANITKRAFLFDTTQTDSWSLARLNTKARTVTAAIVPQYFTTPGEEIGHSANVAVAVDSPNADNTDDAQCHGTKMAGIIAGQTCGVAKLATIIPVKASQGNTRTITQMDIMARLAFAANDAKGKGGVVNISATMRKNQNDGLPEITNSYIAAGMHIVNSAGNGGIDDCAARIGTTDGPITVGNVDIGDVKAFTSNFGSCLTVFAPGNDIQTTAHNNPTASSQHAYGGASDLVYRGFISGSGTSEAAAHTLGHRTNRFVCIGQTIGGDDRLRNSLIGEDYWVLVDAFIAARRAEKFDRGFSIQYL